jgi:hypothetical protein
VKLSRKVASRWGYLLATREAPTIPKWALERAFVRLAFLDEEETDSLQLAKESVNILLPKFLDLLHKAQGETYYMNASGSHGRIFYYFSPKHPVDSFHLMLGSRRERVILNLSYMPHRLDGSPDFQNSVQLVQGVEDPELAGLALMRLGRQLLTRI